MEGLIQQKNIMMDMYGIQALYGTFIYRNSPFYYARSQIHG